MSLNLSPSLRDSFSRPKRLKLFGAKSRLYWGCDSNFLPILASLSTVSRAWCGGALLYYCITPFLGRSGHCHHFPSSRQFENWTALYRANDQAPFHCCFTNSYASVGLNAVFKLFVTMVDWLCDALCENIHITDTFLIVIKFHFKLLPTDDNDFRHPRRLLQLEILVLFILPAKH